MRNNRTDFNCKRGNGMNYLGYIFFVLALVFFAIDMIKVAFLVDLMPFVKDDWKPTISLVSFAIGFICYKSSKVKSERE